VPFLPFIKYECLVRLIVIQLILLSRLTLRQEYEGSLLLFPIDLLPDKQLLLRFVCLEQVS